MLHARKPILYLLAIGLLAGCSLICVAQDPANTQTIKQLRAENEQLRARVSELEKRLEGQSVRDRLVQEEQRVENLLAQMVAVGEKEAALQGRLEEINEQVRPENLEQLPIAGSLRPEQVREAARLRLTNEQNRVRSQLELLQQSRARLQSSLSVTELLVQSLRARLQTVVRP